MKSEKKSRAGKNHILQTIDELRKKIDAIDVKILELINQRLALAEKIGKVKCENENQIVDISRENKVVNRLSGVNKGPLDKKALRHIYTEIIAASREIQIPQRVAYLGPETTFSHLAAVNHFGRSVSYTPLASIPDIFREVEKGLFNFGVVPIENSIEGAVNYTLDLFFESGLKICAEIYYVISHHLISKSSSADQIKRIYSHPHAFAQCRNWLRKNISEAQLIECSSTAEAARRAAEEPQSAAISSREAADRYRLNILASRIEDNARNITRFLIVGHDEVNRTGRDKTSLMFVTAHVPGALYRVLEPIAKADINMLKLESRPTKHENWSYFFFVDLEGHLKDKLIRKTIDEMKQLCFYLKILGSYPLEDPERRFNE